MNRTLTYNINHSGQNLRIEQFLRRQGYSGQVLVQLKKQPENIMVNGECCRLTQKLNAGDALTVFIQESEMLKSLPPLKLPLAIVYEDEDILVVDKAPGLPMHPSAGNHSYSLANALTWYYQNQGKPFIFRCTNRLDRDTSGLTVISKNLLSAGMMSAMAVRHEIQRDYLAIVRGTVTPPCGTISAPLSRKPGPMIERTVDFDHGENAVTHYRTVAENNGHTLLSLRLETGRTHQIRIHLKYLGFPLIGDYLYNPDMEYISRQALHSHCLRFRHPITGKRMAFTAPLPDDMEQVLSVSPDRNAE